MPLQVGDRLGPYEVLSHAGSGGMGEVYRARDTRLDRTVALKVLPDSVAGDPDRRMRFEREARVVASLSHPHICALHDIGAEFLVMEFLEGETLAQRLARGALPLEEVVRFSGQIASALEAAHRQRIVHRDLKPANVMLTRSGVKLLDFGLAKALAAPADGHAFLSTASAPHTRPGTFLGTLPYMAPEQIEGREADARSDIFSFGAVIYEMATGHRAFAAESAAGVASEILAASPPPIHRSPGLDAVVRGCLRRDPDDRWQSAHDVALQVRDAIERDRAAVSDGRRTQARPVPWMIAALAVLAAVSAAGWAWQARVPGRDPTAAVPSAVAFAIPPPSGGWIPTGVERLPFAISTDGRVAFVAGTGDGPPSIWIRKAASETATMLPGTEGASSLFWSPDGKAVAFFAAGKLKRVDADGGTAVTICDARTNIGQSGSWGDGQILFASVEGQQILRVSALGGAPVEVLRPDPAKKEERLVWPSFLPDGRRFLYLSARANDAGAVMLAGGDGSPRDVLPVKTNAQFVNPGFIVYSDDGALLARRFDAATGETSGEPVSLAPAVSYFLSTGLAQFSTAHSGAVLFRNGDDLGRIVTFDRKGKELGVVRGPGPFESVHLSRDGRDLYVERRERNSGTMDIWKIELDRDAESRVTSERGSELDPVFTRDGSIIFSSSQGHAPQILMRPSAGPDVALVPDRSGMQIDAELSPDGRWLLYSQRVPRGNFDIVTVSLADRRATPYQHSDADETGPRFSPDGRYVAFTSDLSGDRHVVVAPFPGPGPVRTVSTGPALLPRWSADGRELFYVGVDGSVYSVPIGTAGPLTIGKPTVLFSRGRRARWSSFEPTRDGAFVALEPVEFASERPLHAILGAFAGRQ